jgi:hypothetical protein
MTFHLHLARRLLAVVVSALALSGLGATALARSATSDAVPAPAESVEATTAWLATHR